MRMIIPAGEKKPGLAIPTMIVSITKVIQGKYGFKNLKDMIQLKSYGGQGRKVRAWSRVCSRILSGILRPSEP